MTKLLKDKIRQDNLQWSATRVCGSLRSRRVGILLENVGNMTRAVAACPGATRPASSRQKPFRWAPGILELRFLSEGESRER
jgi:hypothetical protein